MTGDGLSNHDQKLWALSNVDNPAVLAAIDKLVAGNATLKTVADELVQERYYLRRKYAFLQAERNTLQAELASAQQRLAVAGESVTDARNYIAQLFDPEQRFDTSKQGRFVTETLNFADSALEIVQDIVKGTAAASNP